MLDTEFCRQILKLPEPWVVEDVRVDKPSNRIDVRIGLPRHKRSLFSRPATCPRCHRALPETGAGHRVVRHLNIGEMRTYLTVPATPAEGGANDCGCRRAWSNPGSRFTQEMERQVVEGLHLLGSIDAVAKLFLVNAADVREINGQHRIIDFDKPAPAPTHAVAYAQAHFNDGGLEVAYIDEEDYGTAPAAPPPAPPKENQEAVPPESDPVWQRLIDHSAHASLQSLGLKMLLEQIRLSVTGNASETSRLAAARILRQYFVKHWRRSQTELASLLSETRAQPGTQPAQAPARPLIEPPPETDPGWQYLIEGRIPVHAEAIGLKMLIERLRLTLGSRPSAESRIAGARILREYFVKHRTRHQAELAQVVAAGKAHTQRTAAPAHPQTTAVVEVPPETARCWQLLIDGQLEIQSSAVGLTMLLERIRLTIGRVPSPAARIAAARVLRQYFEKYRSRHEAELKLLVAEDALYHPDSSGQVVEFVEVPPENHPSWDKLIRGELQIRTEALGLKMLLERVRLSLGSEPTEALRLAAARVLRQYFIKHRSRHRAELEQLKAA
ncbi:MAG: transposase family protein [Gammaproteobacteria bacterium]